MAQRELTSKIKEWLDTPANQRDIMAGAELLLRVNRNRIFYNNVSRNPAAKAPRLVYELTKIYNARTDEATREEVSALMAQVGQIAVTRGLDTPSVRSEFQRGKRADHDELPPEVRELWTQNAEIMRKMRDCHTHLRLINTDNSSCPDSDRYPWAKEIVRLDTLMRDNYNRYDHYIKGTPLAATALAVEPRTAEKNALKTINLLIGKYAKSPSDSIADRIKDLFGKIANPTDALVRKMAAAGLS